MTDFVRVKLIRWENEHRTDVILEKLVSVDGHIEVDSLHAWHGNCNYAKFIRQAIAEFDKLIAAHPSLSPKE